MSKKILISICLVLATVFVVIFLQIKTDPQSAKQHYRYVDGSGNTYNLDPVEMTLEYAPITPQESSSRVYSGGEYVKKEISLSQYTVIATALEKAVASSSIHIPDRTMGSGLIVVGQYPQSQEYILAARAAEKAEIEKILKETLQ